MAGRTSSIEIDDLTLAYDRRPAVHHLSGRFEAGSLTAVVGPNGAGKSTLLKAIAGLLRPEAGRISLGLMSPADLAYLPQQAELDRSFPITVADTVALGLWRRLGVFRGLDPAMAGRVDGALAAGGLAGLGDTAIGSLSVGQLQRVLFARLSLQEARAILLDEPFAAVDQRTTGDLLALIQRWHGEGRTVIAVLHDMEQVRAHFPETLLLAREPVAWGRTAEMLTQEMLERARQVAAGWQDPDALPPGKVVTLARRRGRS
jgi:zinc/manganese transport system ATP-binding protein